MDIYCRIFKAVLTLMLLLSTPILAQNNVLVLDGIDDRLETVFDLNGAPRDNFTIEVWVKPAAPINLPDQGGTGTTNHGSVIYPETGRSIAQFDGHKNGGVGLSVGKNGVAVFVQPKIYGGPYHQQIALLTHRVNIEDWTHIAVVFTGRQPTLYLNGKFAARGITCSVQAWLWPKQIGGNNDNFGSYTGMLDELCLWNRPLSFNEIEKHAKQHISGSESGLILYYNFDQIDGDGSFPDLSYKGHKGMLMNGISTEKQSVFTVDQNVVKLVDEITQASDIDTITIQAKTSRPDGIAIIIGIENYKDAPPATFAKNDALTFEKYANQLLGIPTENIYTITDEEATLGEFMKLFGKNGYIKRRVNEKTDVFVYYSGHGAPDFETKVPYLIPYDIDPDYPTTGYSTNTLYQNLSELNARSVTVLLDACFSGATRNNEMLLANARPVRIEMEKSAIAQNITLITASTGGQISSGYPDKGHGLFSYFLMKGMTELSDANGDKKITYRELYDYIYTNVTKTAVTLDREQTPLIFNGDKDQILLEY